MCLNLTLNATTMKVNPSQTKKNYVFESDFECDDDEGEPITNNDDGEISDAEKSPLLEKGDGEKANTRNDAERDGEISEAEKSPVLEKGDGEKANTRKRPRVNEEEDGSRRRSWRRFSI